MPGTPIPCRILNDFRFKLNEWKILCSGSESFGIVLNRSDLHTIFSCACRQCASQGPRVARLATVQAKRQALEHLRAIKDDIQGKNSVLQKQLEEKKREARELKASAVASPAGERLGNIQKIAYAWESASR
jgi:hypothetical protein